MGEASVTLSLAGHEVNALQWSGDDSKAAVLLVPGLGGSSVDWRPGATRLAQETGRTVTVIDLPGFGRSRLRSGRADLALYADVVAAALDDIGPAVVVGNSMGGLVSLMVADASPDRVERLVLLDPALPTAGVSPRAVLSSVPFLVGITPVIGPWTLRLRKRLLGAEGYVEQRLRNNVYRLDHVDRVVVGALVDLTRERMSYPEAEKVYSDAARSIVRRWSEGYALAACLEIPTLVVHGRNDTVVPVAVAERLRETRPDWSFEILDACGHLPHLEHPETFARLVGEFADSQASPATPGDRRHESLADE